MKAVELIAEVDDKHLLQAQVPEMLPPGPVCIIVLIPEEDEARATWMQGFAREWEQNSATRVRTFNRHLRNESAGICGTNLL
jgi:hypothetical protein